MCLNNAGVRETEREGRAAGDTARDRVRDSGQEGWGQGARETERDRDAEDTKPLPAEATQHRNTA